MDDHLCPHCQTRHLGMSFGFAVHGHKWVAFWECCKLRWEQLCEPNTTLEWVPRCPTCNRHPFRWSWQNYDSIGPPERPRYARARLPGKW